jgi:hypothetical protein
MTLLAGILATVATAAGRAGVFVWFLLLVNDFLVSLVSCFFFLAEFSLVGVIDRGII